jgi:predicted dehydrogenase
LLHTERNGKIIRETIPSIKGNYMEFYDGMYEAIRNGAPVPVTPQDGIDILRVIEAAYTSNQEKKVVPLG